MSDADSAEEIIFNAARQLADPDKRRQYLELACEGQPELRRRIERLLGSAREADSFFGRNAAFAADVLAPALHQAPTPATVPIIERPGTRVGRYKLLEQIGEGGFGVVFMAEQEEPVRRRVALKLIKLGMDTKQVVARFEAEQQALALMDHPSIAKVLDAGATETGRPYFVMELVPGVPITEFCDKHQLTAKERINLFIPVCQAIQSAHQKGIIHRDLKPTNILVSLNPDGSTLPKVIDFGVAKATDQRLTEKTLFTQQGMMIGTPAYMSPEQAELSHVDVDTRADIYSLGALLYELLTGSTPFPEQRLRSAGYNEIQRIILHEEPQRPSTRLSTLQGEQRSAVARNRGTNEVTLGRAILGDLDWIVLKCLEKDRARRYATANGLARDLERHLRDEPVVARPPSATDRFRKFVRRNKLTVTAAGAVATVLVLGICASTWEAVRARRAEEVGKRLGYAGKMNMAQAAWEQNRVAQVRQLLEETASHPDRGFEWYYWQRQTHRELKTLRGHKDHVDSVAWSPDGQRIATGSLDTTAKVWDAASFKELLTLKLHLHRVNSIAFSPDSRRIITGSSDGTARIWDAATGQGLCTLDGHDGQITTVAFSPDGAQALTGSFDGTARVWDAATGQELFRLTGRYGCVDWAAFSPDGRRIVTANDDHTLVSWDLASRKEVLTVPAHSGFVESAVYSPDGLRIITGGDESDPTLKVWDAVTGRPLLYLAGHAGGINAARFSADGQRIASASDDQTAKVWEAATGKELFTIKGHNERVKDVAFSPDARRLVTASEDHTAKVWDATGAGEVITLIGHSAGITVAAFSPDGQLIITGAADQTARVWSAGSGKELLRLAATNGPFWCGDFSPDGRWILTGDNQSAKIWDVVTGAFLFALRAPKGGVSRSAFSRDGRFILTGGVDRKARLWDAASRKELHSFEGHTEGISGVAFSPDGRRIVTAGGEGIAIVWDLASYKRLVTLHGHTGVIPSITYSPDGLRILTASADQTARVWDTLTGEELLRLRGHSDEVRNAVFSPDGHRILTSSWDQTAKLWDALTGVELLTLKGHRNQLNWALFSPDGRRIVTAGNDMTAKVWDAATPDQVALWTEEEKNARTQQATMASEQAAGDQQARALTSRDPGAISQWLVLGLLSFEGYLGAKVLADQQVADEAQLRPVEGQLTRAAGANWAWRAVELDDYRLSNRRLFRSVGPRTLAYLATYIVADTPQTNLLMKVGSEDQSKVYLNGREIYRRDQPRKFVADQDVVTGVPLNAGVNVVVFKVVNEESLWRASLRFTDAAGQPVKGIHVTLAPQPRDGVSPGGVSGF